MEGPPFGWPHRHKRSHDEMERSTPLGWSFNHIRNHNHRLHTTHDPHASFGRTPGWYDLEPDRSRRTPFDAGPPYQRHDHFLPAFNPPRAQPMAERTPYRYEGDGYDYRRPATAVSAAVAVDLTREDENEDEEVEDVDLNPDFHMEYDEEEDEEEREDDGEENGFDPDGEEQDIIDLTADGDDSGYGHSQEEDPPSQNLPSQDNGAPATRRLPRGMDIIIDLDNGDEQWTVAQPEPGSPDIEFISSRPISRPPTQRRREFNGNSNGDHDEVEFVSANPLPQEEIQRRRNQELDNVLNLLGTMRGRFTHLRNQVDRFHTQINETANHLRGATPVAPPRNTLVRVGGFMAPDLDFAMVGFDLGMGGVRAQPPPPTYDAPEKAPNGFTRSPAEEDVLVCPNCDSELCSGDGESEVKKQVWVVKGCGHVYCGECTANRSSKRSAKGKERTAMTKPFKECQVTGCGKSVTNRKAMIQIFM